nr:retrotransposon protein, putative, Ty1-copia subclass [Tanacetum cinerariifolium]
LNAMNVEMQSMKDNEVWVLVELPPNGKTVGSKWLFKKKTDMDGNVHIYKARLVAKGFTQTPGIDYEETFSPFADIRAIRILIAIAACYDYEIWQMDVKTAFLKGYLNEEEKLKLSKSQGASSERRNRTLLDMIRSMMSQTTLPKSFWDYALETAARILNMVPTKKVEKTPYEDTQRKRWDILSTTHPRTKSTRKRHAPDRMCLYIDAEEHELGDLGEPANYKAALLDPDKWLFKKKTDMDGNVHIYKARLVAKGFTQTPGIDYEETFSPVADIRAIRILIAIAAYYDYEIWHMDVKTAFLNGYLNEEVYMEQPEGFVNPKYSNRVRKLKRSIYGLKQASRQWNKRFDDEIKKFGFTQNRDEPCVYIKASGSSITFLILYVDDILLMGNSIPMLQSVKTYLVKCFAMKDLGEAAYILGIKIYRDRSKRL